MVSTGLTCHCSYVLWVIESLNRKWVKIYCTNYHWSHWNHMIQYVLDPKRCFWLPGFQFWIPSIPSANPTFANFPPTTIRTQKRSKLGHHTCKNHTVLPWSYLRGPRGPPGSTPTGSTRSRRDLEQRRQHRRLLPLPHRAVKKMWPTRFPGALINRDARRVRFWAGMLDFLFDDLLLIFSWQFY